MKGTGRGGRRGPRQANESGNSGIKTRQQVVVYTLKNTYTKNSNDFPTRRESEDKYSKNQKDVRKGQVRKNDTETNRRIDGMVPAVK